MPLLAHKKSLKSLPINGGSSMTSYCFGRTTFSTVVAILPALSLSK